MTLIPAVIPPFPTGVTHMTSGQVGDLLGVTTDRVGEWARQGLITASFRTLGGARRFTEADVQALAEVCTAAQLVEGDIVTCMSWNGGAPVRICRAVKRHRRVYVRWQDVAARTRAVEVSVGTSQLVRLRGHAARAGVA
ncbi:helix-turn-helix domain-containing protein [Streptosporangium sp. NPDC000239]|uniref:MerR family transcriptional regulator n=1 Tax=Streptosporangium sp. NPDC000239 TaxID=3154248 RepID=UPI003329E32C